jgi:apolipoprotein N-acyltransferase
MLIPTHGAAGAAWAVLIAEVGILSVIIPVQTAKIIGGSPVRLIAHIQGAALLSFAISGSGAWLAQWLLGDSSLTRLIFMGILWALLVAAPLYYLMFNRDRRQWIVNKLREKSGR